MAGTESNHAPPLKTGSSIHERYDSLEYALKARRADDEFPLGPIRGPKRKRQLRMYFMQLNLQLVKQTFPRWPVFRIKGEELSIVRNKPVPKFLFLGHLDTSRCFL